MPNKPHKIITADKYESLTVDEFSTMEKAVENLPAIIKKTEEAIDNGTIRSLPVEIELVTVHFKKIIH